MAKIDDALELARALEQDLRWTGNAPNKLRPYLGGLIDLKIRRTAAQDALEPFADKQQPVLDALASLLDPLTKFANLATPVADLPDELEDQIEVAIMPLLREFAVPVCAANAELRAALDL